jgi:anti-sigma28 factor (negative regulator of flagellin synthesis)
MKKVAVQKDSAQISGNLRPAMNSDYSSLGQLSAKNAVKQSVLQPVVSKVLDDPEPFNQRVAEIKKLISEGGVEAYFNTVDSEKIAQRLLNSGVLDDLI